MYGQLTDLHHKCFEQFAILAIQRKEKMLVKYGMSCTCLAKIVETEMGIPMKLVGLRAKNGQVIPHVVNVTSDGIIVDTKARVGIIPGGKYCVGPCAKRGKHFIPDGYTAANYILKPVARDFSQNLNSFGVAYRKQYLRMALGIRTGTMDLDKSWKDHFTRCTTNPHEFTKKLYTTYESSLYIP